MRNQKLIVFLLTFLVLLFTPSKVRAIYDPLSVPNNRYGVHIIDPVDLEDAAKLVNSSGGDWGYVTLVIRKDERNLKRWQDIFNQMRKLHLIPLVRIATRVENGVWEKPNADEIDGWVSFLNELNWVVKNRYVIIANEPNHAKEWGGKVDPKEYADYLKVFAEKLKEVSSDFFILPAGLDASASNTRETMNETLFLEKMVESNPNIFDYIDGWNSHSYPNPNFSGSENASGKGSVRSYLWELNYLKTLGLNKDLPVFITETGWIHNMSDKNNRNTSTDKIGAKLSFAFQNVWTDKNLVAVTPFILSYLEPPFDVFSWKDKTGNFYPFYTDIQQLTKTSGQPMQKIKAEIISVSVQPIQFKNHTFKGILIVKNTGQAPFTTNNLSINFLNSRLELKTFNLPNLYPNETGVISFTGKNITKPGLSFSSLAAFANGRVTSNIISFPFLTLPSF